MDPATDVGPLINRRGAERVEAQVRQAVADGAKIVTGGKRRDNFFEPTVLTGVTPGTPAFADETFGPVLPLIPYERFEDALALANDSPFGLQAAIFTHDLRKVMRAYEVLDVGTVVVNHTTAVRVETLPFGGNKGSGNGREGIHDTLHEMSKEKTLAAARSLRSGGLMPHLAVSHIAKSYDGNPAVRDISFEVAAGRVLALCGENGAGKSTLMKMLSGATQPDSGEILLDGKAVGDRRPVRRDGARHPHRLPGALACCRISASPKTCCSGACRRAGSPSSSTGRRRTESRPACLPISVSPRSIRRRWSARSASRASRSSRSPRRWSPNRKS